MATLDIIVKAKDMASKTLGGIKQKVGGLTGSFGGLGKMLIGGAVVAGMTKMISAAQVQEGAIAGLDATLKTVGKSYAEVAAEVEATTGALQAKTVFGDEAQIKAISDLTRATGDYELSMQALPALLDFAASAKIDLNSATKIYSQALAGNTSMLKRHAPQLTTLMDSGASATEIMNALAESTEGQAEAMGETQPLTQFTNLLGDLMELIGVALFPVMKLLKDSLNALMPGFKLMGIGLSFVVDAVVNMGKAIGTLISGGIDVLISLMRGEWKAAWDGAKNVTKDAFEGFAEASTESTDKIVGDFNKLIEAESTVAVKHKEFQEGQLLDSKRRRDADKKDEEAAAAEKAKRKEEDLEKEREHQEYLLEIERGIRENRLADETTALEEKWNLIKANEDRIIAMQQQTGDIISSAVGDAFRQAFESGKKGADEFGKVMIRMLLQVIAKLIIANILTSAIGGTFGGKALASITGGVFAGLGGLFQTSPGMAKIVPGSPLQAVPIIAHGGETISRGGSGGGLTVIVQGSMFNADETVEAIRSGLHDNRINTGRTV